MQRILNYMEIRTMVRSGEIGLDINSNIFSHPLYSIVPIPDLDARVKELIFCKKFSKIADASYNPSFKDELLAATSIMAQVVTNPVGDYLDTRNVSSFQLFLNRVINYFKHRDTIVIKSGENVSIPLSVIIREGKSLPELKCTLKEEYSSLVVTSVSPTRVNSDKPTYINVFNAYDKTITIRDLEVIGEIQFVY